ncbi:MAG: DUF2585 domain-containing protein [Hyphomicrobium sp.]|jgi:hypothetical protein|nr:DUF2585 domain-containing protein [Hyphomicrobium sp.]
MTVANDRLFGIPAYIIIAAIIVGTGATLYALGRLPMCACGTIKLWHGEVLSSENSQHITDWYTYSHILHGFLFYAAMWWLAPGWSFAQRLAAAVALEAGWEVLENTPLIIDRYRTATMSLDYYGDSIVNSLSDIAAMMAGFWLASVLPVAVTVALGLFFEVFTGYMIRDNLTLNVLMLIHPIDAVKAWQSAGGAPLPAAVPVTVP